MDLDHEVGQAEACLSTATLFLLEGTKQEWFLRRLNEEEIISAIEQLNVVLVRKRAQKNMEKAA